ncbi:MAG: hypothetical protein SXQ77_06540 [Halobacteria archaeon]|nr:hypothetical protein [Halobacteria archaeon]
MTETGTDHEQEIEDLKKKTERTDRILEDSDEDEDEDEDPEIDELKEKTKRTDRIDEGKEDEDAQSRKDELEYTPIEDVVLRKNAQEDVDGLKEQTKRTNRIEVEEDDEMNLQPFHELEFEGEEYEDLDDVYCGNCDHVTFKKHQGKPQPHCSKWDNKTRLEPNMVCPDYKPQGLSGSDAEDG